MPARAGCGNRLLQSTFMNVVVIAAHGLNCHWLGPYGNEWISSPTINSLACESVLFDRHFANDPSPAAFRRDLSPGRLTPAGIATVLVDDRKSSTNDAPEWPKVYRTDPAGHATPGDALKAAVQAGLDFVAKQRALAALDRNRPPDSTLGLRVRDLQGIR